MGRVGVASTLVLATGACELLSVKLRQDPGPFERTSFESVVAQVRAMKLAPDKVVELRIDDLTNPHSLRPRRNQEGEGRGDGGGNVWAEEAPDGNLKVVIETRDLGHAGEYGFAYSDRRLAPTPFGGAWLEIDVPSHLNLVQPEMRIDDHWWKVIYNLD